MAVYDTSDTIDSSIFLKAKLDKNMVGSNWYLENLQDKRNQDWYMRYNVVNIEEELNKQTVYTTEEPKYTPIEAAIRNVKPIKGEDLGIGWANLAFRDLQHPADIGSRYRFSLDFPENDMTKMSEDEKKYRSNIWICVNRAPINAGNESMVRMCNTALAMKGVDGSVRYEPAILETQLKYMQVYTNMTIPIPQAEWYAILQCNYFTNQIKINDRFLFGTVDKENRENNAVFKVKAVFKSAAQQTYIPLNSPAEELERTSLITLALDKDLIGPNDDLENRVAFGCPVYKMVEPAPDPVVPGDPQVITEVIEDVILLGEDSIYNFDKPWDEVGGLEYVLKGIKQENWNNYFEITQALDRKSFTVKNKKACTRGKLEVTVKWTGEPDKEITKIYKIKLGSFS